jgi:hypothetical protein
MKNGYYIFAYVEINEYANYYKIDTQRHDQNISLWEYKNGELTLLRYWELERLSRIKHHNKAFSTKEQFLGFVSQLLLQFGLSVSELIGIHAPPYFEVEDSIHCLIDNDYNYHSFCHLFSALLMETEMFYTKDILAFSVDLDSDYIIDEKKANMHDYVGCYSRKGVLEFFPIESPAPLWTVASHDMKLGEGTLMALASASSVQFVKELDFSKELFFTNDDRFSRVYDAIKSLANECNENNIETTLRNYDSTFSFDDNVKSAIMKVVQGLSLTIMQRNVIRAIKRYNICPSETILAMSGGFSLNCPTNSSLLKTNRFKGFIAPPCVNDSGQSLGMALYHFYKISECKLSFSFDSAYHGTGYSEKRALKLYMPWITSVEDFDVDKAIGDVMNNAIVWFDGNSEIGPRALGHRSLISMATSLMAKNKINEIKKRQFWRPVAPIVLESEGKFWFEDYIPSKYMLLTFDIKKDAEDIVKAISHLDKSARIQTIFDENERIVQILKRLYEVVGVPILCNTSLNDYKEPIIETPEEAIEFALKKKIHVVYLNGKRITLNTCEDISKLPKLKPMLDLWENTKQIVNPVLDCAEYDFYYWSNFERVFPLDSEMSIKIVKRLYTAFKKRKNTKYIDYHNFYY